jgi:hypothetical protein
MFRTILILSTFGLVYGSTQVAFANEAGTVTGGIGGAAVGAAVGGPIGAVFSHAAEAPNLRRQRRKSENRSQQSRSARAANPQSLHEAL